MPEPAAASYLLNTGLTGITRHLTRLICLCLAYIYFDQREGSEDSPLSVAHRG